jgi:hypothetical protein
MPLVKQRFTLANGATSSNILSNTNYEFISNSVPVIIAAGVDDAGTGGTDGETVTKMNATINNTELTSNGSVSALVSGEPFGYNNSAYQMNNFVTSGGVRNRLNVQFTNNSGATRTIDVAIFISQ